MIHSNIEMPEIDRCPHHRALPAAAIPGGQWVPVIPAALDCVCGGGGGHNDMVAYIRLGIFVAFAFVLFYGASIKIPYRVRGVGVQIIK